VTTAARTPLPRPPSASRLALAQSGSFVHSCCLLAILVGFMVLWLQGWRAPVQALVQALAVLSLIQLAFVLGRLFRVGWLAGFAYLFHWIFIGGACVAYVAAQADPPMPLDQWPLLAAGLGAQLALGIVTLASKPLRDVAQFNRPLLTLLMLVCGGAALVKFGLYLRELQGLQDHLSIYVEGEAVRDSAPAFVRILAAGAPIAALVTLSQANMARWAKALALLAIVAELGIGTRSRPIFLLAGVVILSQLAVSDTQRKRAWLLVVALACVFGAGAIAYFRESYSVGASAFALITIESLASTMQAVLEGMKVPGVKALVMGQLPSLLFPTDRDTLDTVAKVVTVHILPPEVYAFGYGVSSSALLELAAVVGLALAPVTYTLFAAMAVLAFSWALQQSKAVIYLFAVALLPSLLFVWRAELLQLVAPALKAIPFVLLLAIARARPRRARSRRDPSGAVAATQ
jgi:hypothetical protein